MSCSNCLLVIRIQPTVTNCEPVKYSDGQQHVNEEVVVGEAFEDSVLQKLQKVWLIDFHFNVSLILDFPFWQNNLFLFLQGTERQKWVFAEYLELKFQYCY